MIGTSGYTPKVELVQNDVYTTDTLDTKALDILQSGGKVLILAAGKVSYGKEVSQMFTPVFGIHLGLKCVLRILQAFW